MDAAKLEALEKYANLDLITGLSPSVRDSGIAAARSQRSAGFRLSPWSRREGRLGHWQWPGVSNKKIAYPARSAREASTGNGKTA
jgi:hypothetical protein